MLGLRFAMSHACTQEARAVGMELPTFHTWQSDVVFCFPLKWLPKERAQIPLQDALTPRDQRTHLLADQSNISVGSKVACQRKEDVFVSTCLCLCFLGSLVSELLCALETQDSLKGLKPEAVLALGRLPLSLSEVCSYAALCTAGAISLWVSFLNKLLSVHTLTPALWLTLELPYFSFSFGI